MTIITYLLFFYIITKPFYFWASGLPQISDIILSLAFIFTFLTYRPKVIGRIIKDNIYFFIFLSFVIIINLIYSIHYADLNFELKSLYYIFDALGIIVFSLIFMKNKNSRNIFRIAFMITLIVQLVILLTHVGRYYGGVRYMGTFNDPNQFAYFCLLSYSYIYLLDNRRDKLNITNIIYLIIALYLIFKSASTGMLLGAGIFIILLAISTLKKITKNLRKYLPYIFAIAIFGIIITSISIITPSTNIYFNKILNSQIASRVEEKTTKVSGKGDVSLWEERGYDRIAYYPHYIIYGSGEGNYERFERAYHQGELHATLPSILFCYGIIPLYFVTKWGAKKIKWLKLDTLCVYISLLLESFTLINSRQVLFWVLFIVGSELIMKEKYEINK